MQMARSGQADHSQDHEDHHHDSDDVDDVAHVLSPVAPVPAARSLSAGKGELWRLTIRRQKGSCCLLVARRGEMTAGPISRRASVHGKRGTGLGPRRSSFRRRGRAPPGVRSRCSIREGFRHEVSQRCLCNSRSHGPAGRSAGSTERGAGTAHSFRCRADPCRGPGRCAAPGRGRAGSRPVLRGGSCRRVSRAAAQARLKRAHKVAATGPRPLGPERSQTYRLSCSASLTGAMPTARTPSSWRSDVSMACASSARRSQTVAQMRVSTGPSRRRFHDTGPTRTA